MAEKQKVDQATVDYYKNLGPDGLKKQFAEEAETAATGQAFDPNQTGDGSYHQKGADSAQGQQYREEGRAERTES